MAIRFTCPKCGAELNVKDELAGKLGKCPACKNAVTVPRLAPARQEVEEVEEVEEVSEADYVDENDAPRRRPSDVRRGRDDDYDDRPRRSRRDDDDYDDEQRSRRGRGRRDDDEYDDRPSRRGSSRRRRDEDEDYEDEDPEERARRKKQQAKKERTGWRRARTGVLLFFISMCIYGGALSVAMLGVLIGSFLVAVKSTSFDILNLFGYLTIILLLPAYILSVVGLGFTVTSPTRNGAMGLAISSLATAALSAICYLILMFKMFEGGAGGGWFLLFVVLNPLLPLAISNLLGTVGPAFAGGGDVWVLYVLPLAEISRLTLFALYIWSMGKCFRDNDTASAGFVQGIVVPSTCIGLGFLVYLLSLAMKRPTSPWPLILTAVVDGLVIVGMIGWYIFVVGNAKTTLDHST